MRIIAALVVAGLCAWAGYSKTCVMGKRARLMEAFIGDISALSMEIEYRPRELEEIARRLTDSAMGEFWESFIGLLPECQNAEKAWLMAAEGYRPFAVLNDAEKSAVKEAGRGLGTNSAGRQLKNAGRAIAECERLLGNLRAETERKGGMYTRLGVLLGMALALIIL